MIEEEFENMVVSQIFSLDDSDDAQNRYLNAMQSLLNFSNLWLYNMEEGLNEGLIGCNKGEKGDFFKFVSVNAGRLGTKDNLNKIRLVSREDDCFESVEASY
jgi:hypothetical protein